MQGACQVQPCGLLNRRETTLYLRTRRPMIRSVIPSDAAATALGITERIMGLRVRRYRIESRRFRNGTA